MDNYILGGGLISVVYAIIKFIELKWIKKTATSPGALIRETLLVYLSAVIGLYGVDHIQISGKSHTGAFTSKPDF
tara:strand:- start:190 stop:414 length:225 start_codon:yes stop_codon:yes gene_type:complete